MKHLLLLIFGCLALLSPRPSLAQAISADSMINVVLARIKSSHATSFIGELSRQNLGVAFYIEDVTTQAPITKQGYGIYEFGLFGDDIDKWNMWYDATGYRIYNKYLDTEMLGDILDFCKRNNFSESKSFRYIDGFYKSVVRVENFGEREIVR